MRYTAKYDTVKIVTSICFLHFLWHWLIWLKEVFLLADKSGDGLLSVDEVFSLMHKLNVKITNRKLREAFKVCTFTSTLVNSWTIIERKPLAEHISTSFLIFMQSIGASGD